MIARTKPEHGGEPACGFGLPSSGEKGGQRYRVATAITRREIGPSPGSNVDPK
jgi:hypothetical protein